MRRPPRHEQFSPPANLHPQKLHPLAKQKTARRSNAYYFILTFVSFFLSFTSEHHLNELPRGAPATAGPRPSSSRPALLRLSPPRGQRRPRLRRSATAPRPPSRSAPPFGSPAKGMQKRAVCSGRAREGPVCFVVRVSQRVSGEFSQRAVSVASDSAHTPAACAAPGGAGTAPRPPAPWPQR